VLDTRPLVTAVQPPRTGRNDPHGRDDTLSVPPGDRLGPRTPVPGTTARPHVVAAAATRTSTRFGDVRPVGRRTRPTGGGTLFITERSLRTMHGRARWRPLIAALLGTVVTGLGHVYLRRWLRALGWLAVAYAVAALFVPKTALTAAGSFDAVDPLALAPLFLVVFASVVDAYALAKHEPASASTDRNRGLRAIRTDDARDDEQSCPACGKPVDPDIGFCHWCTTEFDELNVVDVEDGRHGGRR